MKRKIQIDHVAEGLASLGFSDLLTSFPFVGVKSPQFNHPYVVKLYGVVTAGDPVSIMHLLIYTILQLF